MRKLWKPGRCPIPGFLFLCPRICCTHRGDGSVFLFPANRSAPKLRPLLVGKQGVRGCFLFPANRSASGTAPVACRETGGAGAVFCFRRIFFVPKHRPADGRSAGLRRNSPNSPKRFAFRAESIRKTLSDCLETRCGEGVCYEIVKYI